MIDIPIIFSAPMVQALLSGRKTMTRRLAWRHPHGDPNFREVDEPERPSPWRKVKPGDRLWVREAWRTHRDHDDIAPRRLLDGKRSVLVSACVDGDTESWLGRRRASMHMPRWASRLTLIVTATKIERLRDISEEDARAEGIEKVFYDGADPEYIGRFGWKDYRDHPHAAAPFRRPENSFESLWAALHGEESWDANPEVVAMSFRVVKANIDAAEARAA